MTREEILRALEQESCEDCCNGNQEEKAKLCQKSYIAGMEHNCENEEIIKVSKGALKARTGRFVIYDVEWLKTHFNTTEAKIYGQPSERTETHECDCISRKAVLDALHSKFADGFDGDKWWNSTHVLDAINKAPSVNPQPKEEPQQKTGHWIWCASSHKCSNCGGYVCFSHKKLLKYCPNCGARMEVQNEHI